MGDFQTPEGLVKEVLKFLESTGKTWRRVLEPTCGRGNFIKGLLETGFGPGEIQGLEIQLEHVEDARRMAESIKASSVVNVRQANVFETHLSRDIRWTVAGPLLVVGNLPWVTNSGLGILGSNNLPQKSNIKGLQGIAAMTGASNFDIAEFIWLKVIKELSGVEATISFLCKISVARNVLQFAYDTGLPIENSSIHRINAQKWFGVAADACLFTTELSANAKQCEAAIYSDLSSTTPEGILGFVGGRLVANIDAYRQVAAIEGTSPVTWRQGVKHDAASVMELIQIDSGFQNKLGEVVDVEEAFVYPLLKGSDVFHLDSPKKRKDRWVIVTQKRLGEDTRGLEMVAPRLWRYLTAHIEYFQKRKSSIYRGRSPFAIFGIGAYAFAPFKVVVSGLHKVPKFRLIGPNEGRPVMLDDTCYFVACWSLAQVALITGLLNDSPASAFIASVMFLDAKRPITKKLLQRIDLKALLESVDRTAVLARANAALSVRESLSNGEVAWPEILEGLLINEPQ